MHVANGRARNSVVSGGLLPVQQSTSYNLVGCQGPTGRKGTKGQVSDLAEDLRPVSEVEAGVNFPPAGHARGQVAVFVSGRQPGPGSRWSRSGAVTPSRLLNPNPRHLGADWVSGNQWAGGRCAVPTGRGSRC